VHADRHDQLQLRQLRAVHGERPAVDANKLRGQSVDPSLPAGAAARPCEGGRRSPPLTGSGRASANHAGTGRHGSMKPSGRPGGAGERPEPLDSVRQGRRLRVKEKMTRLRRSGHRDITRQPRIVLAAQSKSQRFSARRRPPCLRSRRPLPSRRPRRLRARAEWGRLGLMATWTRLARSVFTFL
jgi:hypothetical protein